MRKSTFWVLITDGVSARVCATDNGMTTPLPMPALSVLNGSWSSRHLFAHSLSQFLRDAGNEEAFNRLIIIATPAIAHELNETLAPETRALLIGKIVRDADDLGYSETHMSELRH